MGSPELSVAREKILEHRLLSDLAVLMLRRGVEMDVLRSEFDAQGHDVVLEAAGVIRHVQLKASVDGGTRSAVNINTRLRAKPSGCVIWMNYDPESLGIKSYRWLGGAPGEPLPPVGERLARRTRANAQGKKAKRIGHRLIARGNFVRLAGLDQLADRLFGPTCSRATSMVLAELRQKFGTEWRATARQAIETEAGSGALKLSTLIDGDRVLEQLRIGDEASWLAAQVEQAKLGALNDLGLIWTALCLQQKGLNLTADKDGQLAAWPEGLALELASLIRQNL